MGAASPSNAGRAPAGASGSKSRKGARRRCFPATPAIFMGAPAPSGFRRHPPGAKGPGMHASPGSPRGLPAGFARRGVAYRSRAACLYFDSEVQLSIDAVVAWTDTRGMSLGSPPGIRVERYLGWPANLPKAEKLGLGTAWLLISAKERPCWIARWRGYACRPGDAHETGRPTGRPVSY